MMPNQDEYFGNLALKGFQEISNPETVHWFPLATGWYVVAAVAAIFLGWKLFLAAKRYIADAYRRNALRQLQRINADFDSGDLSRRQYLQQLRQLLKATTLVIYQRHKVASLSGQQWAQFLNQKTDNDYFDKDILALLENPTYRRQYEADTDSLKRFSQCVARWLTHHHRPAATNGAAS
jgi:hypothetical protein